MLDARPLRGQRAEPLTVATTQGTQTDRILAERDRFVARGVATPKLVVARAEGAMLEDVDGRTYVDFAGGLGCQNTGHGLPPAVAAMHEQIDRYLHQCFMVGIYEPYVELCRRLAELSPCRGVEQRSLLVNSGAEAAENAVKIARAATGRPAGDSVRSRRRSTARPPRTHTAESRPRTQSRAWSWSSRRRSTRRRSPA